MSDEFDIGKWEREHSKYFLRHDHGKWVEVSESEFVAAERGAGFFPKTGCGPVATGGFSASGPDGEIEGRIDFVAETAKER